MSETPSIPTPSAKGIKGILSKKVFGIPVLYIAIVLVAGLALYAWRTKAIPEPSEEELADEEYVESEVAAGNLTPISPTGTVYAQSPQAVVENTPYFGNNEWLQRAAADQISKGANPGEVMNALQAFLEGEDLTYQQGLIRDKALKDVGLPPESFRAGASAPKPQPVKPKSSPAPAPPKPVAPKPAPKPAPPKRKTHKVVRGDTLWDLAGKYYGNGSQWKKISKANNIRNPKTLQIGRILVIP